jgi:hypothetical protein
MERQDKKSVLEALGEVRSKFIIPERRSPQDCGDIGLRIARDGTWYYQNSAIGRRPLVKLFASVLRREKDGRYYLVTPAEKALVHVEDAPFLAVAMEAKSSGKRQRLTFRTNLDEMVEAGPEHPLSFRTEKTGGFTPFVLVRDRLKARLTRPVYYELVAGAVTETRASKKELGVWSGGEFFPFPELQAPRKG